MRWSNNITVISNRYTLEYFTPFGRPQPCAIKIWACKATWGWGGRAMSHWEAIGAEARYQFIPLWCEISPVHTQMLCISHRDSLLSVSFNITSPQAANKFHCHRKLILYESNRKDSANTQITLAAWLFTLLAHIHLIWIPHFFHFNYLNVD